MIEYQVQIRNEHSGNAETVAVVTSKLEAVALALQYRDIIDIRVNTVETSFGEWRRV